MIKITKKKSDNYTFELKSESGHTLLNSISFSNEERIKETVNSLNDLSRKRDTFERKTNYNGEFLFCVKNMKGEIIGKSQLYQSEAGMENGIQNFKHRINSISKNNKL